MSRKRDRDVDRYAFENGLDPSTLSPDDPRVRAYTAQIACNRMIRRLLVQRGDPFAPAPPTDHPVELWRFYKHPPNLYAKFRQSLEKARNRS